MADFFYGAASWCERWMDTEGTPLRLDICRFLGSPEGRDRSGWKVRVTEVDGVHERLSIDVCFRLYDWVQLRMHDPDSPGHAERMSHLLKSIVDAVRQVAFMRTYVGRSEFYLLDQPRNVLGLHVAWANAGDTGPRFYFDKDPEYEALLAHAVRDKVLAILRSHFTLPLISDNLYLAVPIGDAAIVEPQVEWLLSNGYVVKQEPSDANPAGGFRITDAGLDQLKSPAGEPWTCSTGQAIPHAG